jgi:hypothetical protein
MTSFRILVVIFGLLAFALIAAPIDRANSAAATKPGQLTKAEKAKAEQLKRSAPADEYFGRMKMSYLGINNTFRDEAIRAGDHTINDGIIAKVLFAEESLRAWRQKYPRDPQVARSLFLASLVDLKIWAADFQQRAAHYLMELREKYSKTFFGKQAKAALQKGMTMNFFAAAQPCTPVLLPGPTIAPKPLPTADAKNNIKVNLIPVPCFTPEPTPSATPGPSMTPQSRITPQPSITPRPSATPQPSPTPVPSVTLRPSPTPVPSVTLRPSPTPAPSVTPGPSPTPVASVTPRPSPTPLPR